MENVMNYEDFINEFKQKVIENSEWNISEKEFHFYPKGYKGTNEVEQEFIRETNMKYYLTDLDMLLGDFVVLQKCKSVNLISANRYCLKKMYEEYLINGWENILNVVDANISIMRNKDVDDTTEGMKSYDKIKDKLIVRPLNYTKNEYNLKNAVYKVVGDIALVLYVRLKDTGKNLISCKMDKTLFSMWCVDEEEVFEIAMKNTNDMAMPRLYFNQNDAVAAPYYRGEFMSRGSKITRIRKNQVPILTTTRQLNGAIALFYPGVKEKISEMIGGSYYIVFTSIHDARIHAVGSISPRRILNSLKEVNRMFKPEEILSRKVFCYDAKEGKLKALDVIGQ